MGAERRQGAGLLSGVAPLVVDTDLGSDPDDELALAFVWGSPELALSALVTSYGDPALRARIAARMGVLAGRPVPTALGVAAPRSGAEVWWAGHEGAAYEPLPELPDDLPSGVAVLTGIRAGHLLAIAPLTTVAAAFDTDPQLAGRLDRLTVMGGDFSPGAAPEHNIRSDVDAARVVFERAARTTVVGLDITRQVRLGPPELAWIARAGALGGIIHAEIVDWMARWQEPFEVPHDPLAALTLVRPDLFTFSAPGRIRLTEDGATRHVPGEGETVVVTAVDAPRAAAAIVDRVVAGLAA